MMTINKINVRCFSLTDLNRIMEIEHASFTIDSFSEDIFMSWYHKCPYLFIVAEISGVVVGYMITCIAHTKGYVASIAVDPAYRHKSVGKTLVYFTFNHLKMSGVKIIELEVRSTNIESIRFWENLGFFPLRTISNFYNDGTDALKMRKLLGNS
ncbi:MAG: GNAT family N-acetyltransferase [Candidatus Hydromicrobium sp.]